MGVEEVLVTAHDDALLARIRAALAYLSLSGLGLRFLKECACGTLLS